VGTIVGLGKVRTLNQEASQPKWLEVSRLSFNTDILRSKWMIIPLLVIALAMRIPYVPIVVHPYDSNLYAKWGSDAYHGGIFKIYETAHPDYPPIYLTWLGIAAHLQALTNPVLNLADNPSYLMWLKLFSIFADLVIIVSAFFWLKDRPRLRLIIPLWLAISPAIIGDSAWWGQADTVLSMMLVLSVLALNRDRPRLAWAFLALGLLVKFQAIVLLPMVGVLSLRRYGVVKTAQGMAIAALVGIAVLAPFAIASGVEVTIDPYMGGVDRLPYITIHAYNGWFSTYLLRDIMEPNSGPFMSDKFVVFGAITLKHIGLLMLAIYTAVISVNMWRRANERREFIWGTALYFGFFMLPTQMHDRYVLPGAIFAIFAIAQDPRMLLIALGMSYTVSYNILIHAPFQWLGLSRPDYWPENTTMFTVLLNVLLFIETTQFMITQPPSEQQRVQWWRQITIARVGILCVSIALIVIIVVRFVAFRLVS
jgi:hypothetical protein